MCPFFKNSHSASIFLCPDEMCNVYPNVIAEGNSSGSNDCDLTLLQIFHWTTTAWPVLEKQMPVTD